MKRKETWWEIFLMNLYKGAYNAPKKTGGNNMEENEINKKYRATIAANIFLTSMLTIVAFGMGIVVGIAIGVAAA